MAKRLNPVLPGMWPNLTWLNAGQTVYVLPDKTAMSIGAAGQPAVIWPPEDAVAWQVVNVRKEPAPQLHLRLSDNKAVQKARSELTATLKALAVPGMNGRLPRAPTAYMHFVGFIRPYVQTTLPQQVYGYESNEMVQFWNSLSDLDINFFESLANVGRRWHQIKYQRCGQRCGCDSLSSLDPIEVSWTFGSGLRPGLDNELLTRLKCWESLSSDLYREGAFGGVEHNHVGLLMKGGVTEAYSDYLLGHYLLDSHSECPLQTYLEIGDLVDVVAQYVRGIPSK